MRWRVPRYVPWETPYPLPADTSDILLAREGASDNAGLLMDCLLPYNDSRWGASLVREFSDRRALVPDYTSQTDLIAACRTRWEAMAAAMKAATFTARPEWRVVVGLGTNEILQGGITLHHVYGIPIVPATALKGVARYYAEAVEEASVSLVGHLFGQAEEEARRGDLVFLDGIPVTPPQMERDLMNPHWVTYYGGRENVPPAEYIRPNPIFFLTIGKESPFLFGVASISKDETAVKQGITWLQQGLQDLGVGAKTANGYGYWTDF